MSTFNKTLYAKSPSGKILSWEINGKMTAGNIGLITIFYGDFFGIKTPKYENVLQGKQNRSIQEQMMSRIESKINKKLDSGYVHTIEDAQNKPRVNSLGLQKPMLAAKYDEDKFNFDFERKKIYVQKKYNGHRCLVTNQNGTIIAYSRQGKIIDSIDHIIEDLNLLDGQTVDGELYCHGEKLQTISSWIKRKQENSLKLKYIVYDVMENKPYVQRLNTITDLIDIKSMNVFCAPSILTISKEDIKTLTKSFIDEGYEGSMIRHGDLPYEHKRSKSLLKFKMWQTEEYLITDVIPSKDGWGILVCQTKAGKSFNASAPGDHWEKEKALDEKEKLIGTHVTIKFVEKTKDGIPSPTIAVEYRDLSFK